MLHKFLILLLFPICLMADQRYNNSCQQGGKTVITSGVSGAPRVQGSYPQCQVRVYLTGTLTLATIYSDNISTPKANPFTANTDGSFFFYAANGRYDVTLSGGGLPAPVTIGDVLLADPFSGGGGVTSFNGRTGVVVPAIGDYSISQITNFPVAVAAEYDFAARSCNSSNTCTVGGASGMSLGIGANALTMTPVPYGVNGTDAKHYLYISGGVGSAEACLISGGAGTSGSTTGQIIITCANTHTGSWVINSANCGITEAEFTLPAGSTSPRSALGTVALPPTNCIVRGAIPYMRGVTFQGEGRYVSRLTVPTTTSTIFDASLPTHAATQLTLVGDGVSFRDFQIDGSGLAATNTAVGIKSWLAAASTDYSSVVDMVINGVAIQNVNLGIFIHRGNKVSILNSDFYANTRAIFSTAAITTDNPAANYEIFISNLHYSRFCIDAAACDGFNTGLALLPVIQCIHCEIFTVTDSNIDLAGGVGGADAIAVVGASERTVIDNLTTTNASRSVGFFGSLYAPGGVVYYPSYISIDKLACDSIWFTCLEFPIGTSLTDPGGSKTISITNSEFTNVRPEALAVSAGIGINLQPYTRNVTMSNNKFANWLPGAGTQPALLVGAHADNISITDNLFTSGDSSFTGGSSTGIFVNTTATNVRIPNQSNLFAFFDVPISDTAASVASATTMAIPAWRDQIYVTGNTTIATINTCAAAQTNYTTTLMLPASISVTKGSNLHLTANLGPTVTDGTLTLKCDGTNWREVARSVN